MAMPYTSGNWSVSREHLNSVTDTKSFPIATIDWAADWSVTTPPASYKKQGTDQENYFTSARAYGTVNPGSIVFKRARRKNLYDSPFVNVDGPSQLPQKSGTYASIGATLMYDVVNSVSGAEYRFPVSGSQNITIPTATFITNDLLYDFVAQMTGMLCSKLGLSPDILASIVRGDLNPLG